MKQTTKTMKKRSSKSKPAKAGQDIVKVILEHHKPLKKLIKVMKNADKSLSERKKAFTEFAPLLIAHAKPEEQVLYTHMKADSKELRIEGCEGDVEHSLADQLVKDVKKTVEEAQWTAKVKVLAELVEHHIEEEEDELLPDFKKNSTPELREQLGEEYLMRRKQYTAMEGIKGKKGMSMPRKLLETVQQAMH